MTTVAALGRRWGVVTLMSGRGTCGARTLRLAAPFYFSVARFRFLGLGVVVYGTVCYVADTAHGVQFFGMYSFVITTNSTTHKNTKISSSCVRVTWCMREVCENCVGNFDLF